jgi:hypothetical protein
LKRRGRKIESLREPRFSSNELQALLHFQLCHVCLYLNESSEEISTCKKCGEPFLRPEDPHADEDLQSVMKSDPFEDFEEGDGSESLVTEIRSGDEDEEPSYQEKDRGLYGLRVRW